MSVAARIEQKLAALDPEWIEIRDESLLHAGHSGAGQGGHYRLCIVSSHFRAKTAMLRHRMVYALLDELMPGAIHALAVKAHTPEEYSLSTN